TTSLNILLSTYQKAVTKKKKIFTRLVGLLNIVLPAVDPALFVARYFRRLRYRDKRIMGLAVRIVQRMKRDWIVVGKRPNNVCGAALLVAGRVYGEDRSMQEVARVVNVCVSSIKKRLGELNMTKSADVSVKEFVEVWLEEDCGYRNCFDFKGFNEGGGELEGEKNNKPENYEENDEDDKPDIYKNDSDNYKPDSFNYKNDSDKSDNYKNNSDNYKPDKTYNLNNINLDDEIPSSEISEMILSEDEFRRREKIWDQMYGEFMREKEQKRKMQKMQKNRKIVENKIRRERSSRINYKSLEKILKD
ncbi:Transcription factor IIIB 90 kDa subunit, partial [Dictyocoela roeselum]